MSGHTPHISEGVLRALPSQVSRITQGVLLAIGIASTGITIAGEWSHGYHFLDAWLLENVSILGASLNVLLIMLVLFPGRIRELDDDVTDDTVRAMIRCINSFCLVAWQWFWFCLGMLYVTLLFTSIVGHHGHEAVDLAKSGDLVTVLPMALVDAFSIGSTAFLVLLYMFLTPGFLRRCHKASQPAGIGSSGEHWSQWRAWPQVMGVRTTLLLSAPIVAMRVLVGRYRPEAALTVEMAVSLAIGLASAIALACFTGRMDSKFIFNWRWIVPVLFVYAGIQVYNSALYEPEVTRRAVLVYGAFTMKCMLFIFMSNFFETRRIVYYAVELVQADEQL